MNKFLIWGFVTGLLGLADAGSCQYAPIAKDAYPFQRGRG